GPHGDVLLRADAGVHRGRRCRHADGRLLRHHGVRRPGPQRPALIAPTAGPGARIGSTRTGDDGGDMTDNQGFYEEFKVTGDNVMAKVRELVEEGNVRRVFLKSEEGRTLLEIPLTAGVAVTAVATMFAPVLVAVGAVSALLTR